MFQKVGRQLIAGNLSDPNRKKNQFFLKIILPRQCMLKL